MQALFDDETFVLSGDRVTCKCSSRTFFFRNARKHTQCQRHVRYMQAQIQDNPPVVEVPPPLEEAVFLYPRPVRNINPRPCPARRPSTPLEIIYEQSLKLGDLEILDFLIDQRGCSVNEVVRKETPLITAINTRQDHLVSYLINKGVDINATDISNRSPLGWACFNGDYEVARLLITIGADETIRDYDRRGRRGRTPEEWARYKGYNRIVDLFHQDEFVVVARECNICMEEQNRFWECKRCHQQHCQDCHGQIEGRKCPFCRERY